eukprot:gene13835-16312_t
MIASRCSNLFRSTTLVRSAFTNSTATRGFAAASAGDKRKPKDVLDGLNAIDEDNEEVGASQLKLTSKKSAEVKPEKKVYDKPRITIYNQKDTTTVLLNRQFQPTYNELAADVPVITQAELKQLIESNESKYTLIDLRDPKEFFGDLPIKQSTNLPMEHTKTYSEAELENHQKQQRGGKKGGKKVKKQDEKKATVEDDMNFWQKCVKLTSAQWKDKYGFVKVQQEDRIIFYSANNGRATLAAEMAIASGYTNVQALEGGIRLWNKFENKQ